MKHSTAPSEFTIHLDYILKDIKNSKINFEVFDMERFRLIEWINNDTTFKNNGRDYTKNIILIDSIGLVDGYFQVMRTQKIKYKIIFLTLRNVFNYVEDNLHGPNKDRLFRMMCNSDYHVGPPVIFKKKFFKDIIF